MIFLSHNHKDKGIVEQIAIRLRDIFGQDHIFYDSWSMQPGDGIIDKMNEGLGKCKLFLFFVSKNSLQSNMVKLEWQNAVMKAANSQLKIIPVKLDDCLMPPILLQSLYIDLFGEGLEVALRQIVDISEGKNTFPVGPQQFSNLKAYMYPEGDQYIIECRAEHYLEPKSRFLFLSMHEEYDLTFKCRNENMFTNGFNKALVLNTGETLNGQFLAIESGTMPGFPFVIEIKPKSGIEVEILRVMHEKKMNEWQAIPFIRLAHKPKSWP